MGSTESQAFSASTWLGAGSIGHWIDGVVRAPVAAERQVDVFNPATGAVARKVALAEVATVDQAVRSAAAAFPAWAATPPLRRARVMFKFKELLDRHAGELASDHHRRARQGVHRRARRSDARHGGGRVRLRHSAAC